MQLYINMFLHFYVYFSLSQPTCRNMISSFLFFLFCFLFHSPFISLIFFLNQTLPCGSTIFAVANQGTWKCQNGCWDFITGLAGVNLGLLALIDVKVGFLSKIKISWGKLGLIVNNQDTLMVHLAFITIVACWPLKMRLHHWREKKALSEWFRYVKKAPTLLSNKKKKLKYYAITLSCYRKAYIMYAIIK